MCYLMRMSLALIQQIHRQRFAGSNKLIQPIGTWVVPSQWQTSLPRTRGMMVRGWNCIFQNRFEIIITWHFRTMKAAELDSWRHHSDSMRRLYDQHFSLIPIDDFSRVANSLLSQELKLCFSDTKFTKAPYTKKDTRFFLDTNWDTEQYQILSHTKIFWWY